ncbi:MAG: helix-turn-helix transcriptional regulator [Bacteroidetes bacterium]|nr:helix-turn-helix transcriptional regulator [Bacteroidota bacterium]MBL0064591.1 helix-turn-helix transcriptional regulator [Bacteroidota bacterium]
MKTLEDLENSFSPEEDKNEIDLLILCKKISEEIRAKGWTRKDFAEKMNVDPALVSRWLGGVHVMGYDTLRKIERVLEIEIFNKEFLEVKPKHKEKFEPTNAPLDMKQIAMLWGSELKRMKKKPQVGVIVTKRPRRIDRAKNKTFFQN